MERYRSTADQLDASDQTARALYHRVRARFVEQGTSLNAWLRERGLTRLQGLRALSPFGGPKSRELRARILEAAGLAGEEE